MPAAKVRLEAVGESSALAQAPLLWTIAGVAITLCGALL